MTVSQATRSANTEAAAGALALGTVAFLLLRPSLSGLGTAPLAAGYLAIGLGSVGAARAGGRPREHAHAARARDPWIPLAVGVIAVLVARATAGPAPALPVSVGIVALSVAAAVAEEAFFRGFLYARLAPWGVGVAVVVSAAAFALIHLPLYGTAAFPVDLGAGLLLSWQRAATGRWTVPAATHAFADVLAVLR
jgi:membrane protease YdiL (CAAX protease family)